MTRHAVLYVPGLGDWRSRGQRIAVGLWRLQGVYSEVALMRWHRDEPFKAKLERLVQRIDELSGAGYTVSLVGVSAGASVVVNAFSQRQHVVHRVVCICGKLRNPETITAYTYRHNPAFRESLTVLPGSISTLPDAARSHILSIRPLADYSVPPADTIVPGFETRVIPTRGHALSIGLGITIHNRIVLGFIKR